MKTSFRSMFCAAYGELLRPRGFSLLNSKYPYFVRVTDGGMLQSISYAKQKADLDPECEGFAPWLGCSPLSYPAADYHTKPDALENQAAMQAAVSFYHSCSLYLDGFAGAPAHTSFFYRRGDADGMQKALRCSQAETMPFILGFFDRCTSPEALYESGICPYDRDLAVLAKRNDAYTAKREREFPAQYEELCRVLDSNPMMKMRAERDKQAALARFTEEKQWLAERKPGGAAYESFMRSAADTGAANLRMLSALGADIKTES